MWRSTVIVLTLLISSTVAFVPSSFVHHHNGLFQPYSPTTSTERSMMMADSSLLGATSISISMGMDAATQLWQQSSCSPLALTDAGVSSSNLLLSFADQGQNLAGIFFQASLLPYLLFLYFLAFRGNRISDVGNFGFQFILAFVFFTIPSGIISKATYGETLANVDWLHGGAELLLTICNVLIVWGFKEASTNPNQPKIDFPRYAAFATAVGFALACAVGPMVGFEAHSAFAFGLGDLPADTVASLPWVTHAEPANALSIPTWAIHFSSVIEYLIAMELVWNYSKVTGNEKWKGLTWGMLPLHASGVCACTYHFFYNPATLQLLVSMQAGFTLLGNLTCAIAAFRIAQSNGWGVGELNPFANKDEPSPRALIADENAVMALVLKEPKESNLVLGAKVVALTVGASYVVKYGELGLDAPFNPSVPLGLAMVLGVPAITAYVYYSKSGGQQEQGEGGFKMPFMGDNALSMADVKKFGLAGTLAYVLTELAFWIVAFPVAATALYQSTGHWPDVFNDNTDRAAVLAFIFAGANIARAFVPLRLGAALALAPWVDENLLNRDADKNLES